MSYCIHEGYKERLDNAQFDDTTYTDEHQNEVYAYAKNLFIKENYQHTVLDVGCGSGFKLMKYFRDSVTIGVDLEPTVKFLMEKYPTRAWFTSLDQPYVKESTVDLLICSDVIEHVTHPGALLMGIYELNPKKIVISTPDRDLLFNPDGPPRNPAHVREWSYSEFEEFISMRFNIEDHFLLEHTTQCIVCTPRIDISNKLWYNYK